MSAFSEGELRTLFREEFGKSWDEEHVAAGRPWGQLVNELLSALERRDQLRQFVEAMARERPGRPELAAIVRQLDLPTPQPLVASTAASKSQQSGAEQTSELRVDRPPGGAVFAQLSDLHFCFLHNDAQPDRRHDSRMLRGVEQVVAVNSPDRVVVTGDLTSEGDPLSLERAQDWLLRRIAVAGAGPTGLGLGDDGARLTVVSGNADATEPPHEGRTGKRLIAALRNYSSLFPPGAGFDWLPFDGGAAAMLIRSELAFLGSPGCPAGVAKPQYFSRSQRRLLLREEAERLFKLYRSGTRGLLRTQAGQPISPEAFAGALKILVCHHPILGDAVRLGVARDVAQAFTIACAMTGVRVILCGHTHRQAFTDDLIGRYMSRRTQARYGLNAFRRMLGIEELPPQFYDRRGRQVSRSLSTVIVLAFKALRAMARRSPSPAKQPTGDLEVVLSQLNELLVRAVDDPRQLTEVVMTYLSKLPEADRTLFDRQEFEEIERFLHQRISAGQMRELSAAARTKSLGRALNAFKRARIVQRRCSSSGKFAADDRRERGLFLHHVQRDNEFYWMRTWAYRWESARFTRDAEADAVLIRPA